MPWYDFKCTQCEKSAERDFPMCEKPKELIEHCEGCQKVTRFVPMIGVFHVPFRTKRGRDFFYSETKKPRDKSWRKRVMGNCS